MREFFETKVQGDVLVITPHGNLTLRPELTELTAVVRAHPKAAAVVLDLSNTDRMDSAGLGELVLAYGAATGQGQALRIACAADGIQELVRMARLDRILLFSDTTGAALAEF
jgi:anti-anti-sigma factor